MFLYTIVEGNVLEGISLVELLTKTFDIGKSKSEIVRSIRHGELYVNNEKITNVDHMITHRDIMVDRYVLIGFGKKRKLLLDFDGMTNENVPFIFQKYDQNENRPTDSGI